MSDKNNYRLIDDINMKQFEKEESDKSDISFDEIDISSRHWYSEFEPITFKNTEGNIIDSFKGTFYGYKTPTTDFDTLFTTDCYSISGLTICRDSNNVGLFSSIKSEGSEVNVGAISFNDIKIQGKKNVGILAGTSASCVAAIFVNNMSKSVVGVLYP